MTAKQFQQLKVGDIVMNSALTKEVKVLDISRSKGLINTGGAWRRFKGVCLAGIPKPENFTRLEPVTHVTLSIKALKRFSLVEVLLVDAIRRAGPNGFLGNNETLLRATQMDKSIHTANVLLNRLVRDGIVIRENLANKATLFFVDEEKAKDYL